MSKPSFSFLISLLLIFILIVPGFGQTRVGKLGVGVEGSMQYGLGAGTVTSSAGLGGGVNLSYSLLEGLSLRSKFVVNQLSWTSNLDKTATTDIISLNGYLGADLLPNSSINPFLLAGGAFVFYEAKNSDGTRHETSSFDVHYMGGVGADFFPNEFWSISIMGEYVMTYSEYYIGNTGSIVDRNNDSFIRASLQLRYYFFDELFVTKLLETQRDKIKRR
jgi:hypothetical protein